jgi:hypothetical protein
VQEEESAEDEVAALMSRLLQTLKQKKLAEGGGQEAAAAGPGASPPPRVYTTDELISLSYDQLLEFQDNLNLAIRETRERDGRCAVCMQREKDSVCVPCGHRFCGTCIKQFPRCAECRADIEHTMRCY